MGLGTLYQDILTTIETDLKTITELGDSSGPPIREKVKLYKDNLSVKQGEYECVIVPSDMVPVTGVTSHGTWNEFTVHIDLLYWRDRDIDTDNQIAFLKGLSVAEKIYDKFHLKKLGGLVKLTRASIHPLEGTISQRNVEAIPIRVTLRLEQPVIQL